MQIAIENHATLRLSFATNQRTLAFVRSLTGREFDKDRSSWTVPLYHLRRVLDAYPDAAVVDRPLIVRLRMEQWQRWVWQHNACGVWFSLDYDCETVVPVGDGVSPAFVEWCASRSNVLIQFLGDQYEPVRMPRPAVTVEATAEDRLMQAAFVGGHKVEQRKAEMADRRKTKRRTQAVQGSLLEGAA